MEYRRLGKSGLQLSALSFGSWLTFGKGVDASAAEKMMQLAYDEGVNFFDNAEMYALGKSEMVMGNVLNRMNWSRDSYVVSSKVFWGGERPNQFGLCRKHVMEACHAAMKRLKVDYLDLYFCHRPDKNTPIEETVWAMHNLIQQGKVLYWGTSEWSAQEIQEAHGIARQHHLIPPTMEQPQYHMFHRDKVEVEYAQLYKNIGLGTTIWSPLASGLLSGKYNQKVPKDSRLDNKANAWLSERELTKEKINKTIKLTALAEELGMKMAQLAIAWCLKNPDVSSVILGATKTAQLKENLKSLEMVPLLTEEVLEKIENILKNKPEKPQF